MKDARSNRSPLASHSRLKFSHARLPRQFSSVSRSATKVKSETKASSNRRSVFQLNSQRKNLKGVDRRGLAEYSEVMDVAISAVFAIGEPVLAPRPGRGRLRRRGQWDRLTQFGDQATMFREIGADVR